MRPPPRDAFTLIELLIVVAIVAILVAIALPNFLDAQVRSKVSRAKTDMRSLATALEAYRVDWEDYPPPALNGHGARLRRLSTPVAYISEPDRREPFEDRESAVDPFPPYGYHGRNEVRNVGWNNDGSPALFNGTKRVFWWLLRSSGPDNDRDGPAATALNSDPSAHDFALYIYDPTNGTASLGDIWRHGGEPTGLGADSASLMGR